MFAAVRQRFTFLLEQAEFLQVVRTEADEVALASDGDLQCLPNPPRRIGRQASAVAHVESINGLHQAAHGFLKEIGIAEGVMTEAFGDVSGKADVSGRKAMFIVHVAIVKPANRNDFASPMIFAVFADELCHWPRFTHGRAVRSQVWEVANERLHEVLLAIPEIREQFAFFFGSEEVGGKRGERSVDRLRRRAGSAEVTFLPLRTGRHPEISQKTE